MTEEEKAIENLIKDYEICIKEAEYEGNVEQKEGLTEVKEILKNALNLISNLQKELEELKQDNNHQWEERCKLTFELEKLQKELDIKDKVIEKTCKYINEAKIMNKAIPVYPNKRDTPYTVGVASIEEIKQHFYKQVEKVGGEDE